MKMKKRLLSVLLSLVLVLGLMPGMSLTAFADEPTTSYTITIPSTLTVANTGWNATDGISATGMLADGMTLIVTAASDGEFALVSGTNKVNYKLAESGDANTTYADATEKTSWAFKTLSNDAATQPMGIIVEDYSSKPAGNYTDTVIFTAKVQKIIDLSTLTADYTAQNGEVLSGTLGANVKISIADGATVTLKDATITNLGNNCNWAGINCPGDATLVLEGTNTVCAGLELNAFNIGVNYYPGIWIAPEKTLTIDGGGSLTAYSNATNPKGAGIGGGYFVDCGNIVINGGNITATGGTSAGIGAGYYGNCGNITINGGTITATGGSYGAGIGGSDDAEGNGWGSITINGGTITATGGEYGAAGIGAGSSSKTCTSSITINGGTITATGGKNAAGIGGGRGGDSYYPSCGNITIQNTVTKVTATKGSGARDCIGSGERDNSCGTVTIGGTVYYNHDWDAEWDWGYENDGDNYLTTSPLIYQP